MSRIYLSPPDVSDSDRDSLIAAFDTKWIAPVGDFIQQFENAVTCYLNAEVNCIALASGTAALHLALKVLDIEAGDRVFVSSFTFVACANAIKYCGAEPVFIDSNQETWNMCPNALEEAFVDAEKRGKLPKAVMVVDLYGQCADYAKIIPICRKYGVPVIQDAAEALGANYHKQACGLQGDISVFSFNGNKIITTSGGGMLVSANRNYTEKARYLATQACEPAPHYEHLNVGYNYRLSNLLAAMGVSQLKSLPEKIAARRRNFEYYKKAFADIPEISFIPFGVTGEPNYWLTSILIEDQEGSSEVGKCVSALVSKCGSGESSLTNQITNSPPNELLRLALEAENIESRPLWKPMHLQPVYKDCEFYGSGVSEDLFGKGLCLPSGSNLTEKDLKRICDIVKKTIA